jgi:hypothetical protein
MQIDVPFFSQLDEQVPQELRRSVCAIACAKMVLDSRMYSVSFADLLKEANIVGGRESAGWTHETIVRVLRNHGIPAYRQEFKAHVLDLETGEPTPAQHSGEFAQQGILKIRRNIDDGNPVLVSVSAGFSDNSEDHVVLVIGYNEDSLIILDPLQSPDSNPVHVPIRRFMDFWKRLTIFTE